MISDLYQIEYFQYLMKDVRPRINLNLLEYDQDQQGLKTQLDSE